jgi:excisionase family DNA binding protein
MIMSKDMKPTLPDKEYFTTGEAATICAVTPNAVLKWVAAGRLAANRTPGGHHRIPRSALQELLMGRNDIAPIVPNGDVKKPFLYCWEFNAKSGRIQEGCYEMARLPQETGHSKLFCDRSCEECKYYEMIHSRTPNILLATDRPALRRELKSQVKDINCNLQFTDCEYHCSMVVESFQPDYVVIDCSIGSERSRDFAENLSEDPRIPYARIILAGNPQDLPEECDHLVFAFISRPLNLTTLDELIGGLQEES